MPMTLTEALSSAQEYALALEDKISKLEYQVNLHEQRIDTQRVLIDKLIETTNMYAPGPVPSPVSPAPASSTAPAPSTSTSIYKVGDAAMFTLPISNKPFVFEIKQVIEGQHFESQDTARLMNNPHTFDQSIFVNCTFKAGRYALWANDQNYMAFIKCTFTDDLGTPSTDECCVRLESCDHIVFKDCKIDAHGSKHALRIHGYSYQIVIQDTQIVSQGNGCMFGSYLGSTLSDHHVSTIELCNVSIDAQGPDVFDPKRDGSLEKFGARNVTVRFPMSKVGFDVIADINAKHPENWILENFTSIVY